MAASMFIYLIIYLYVHIQRSITGNKLLDVEFVNIYNKHIMVLPQDKYRNSHCTHKNGIL